MKDLSWKEFFVMLVFAAVTLFFTNRAVANEVFINKTRIVSIKKQENKNSLEQFERQFLAQQVGTCEIWRESLIKPKSPCLLNDVQFEAAKKMLNN